MSVVELPNLRDSVQVPTASGYFRQLSLSGETERHAVKTIEFWFQLFAMLDEGLVFVILAEQEEESLFRDCLPCSQVPGECHTPFISDWSATEENWPAGATKSAIIRVDNELRSERAFIMWRNTFDEHQLRVH